MNIAIASQRKSNDIGQDRVTIHGAFEGNDKRMPRIISIYNNAKGSMRWTFTHNNTNNATCSSIPLWSKLANVNPSSWPMKLKVVSDENYHVRGNITLTVDIINYIALH